MANKGPSCGLSRQCYQKTLKKFDPDYTRIALQWIEDVLGEKLSPSSDEMVDHLGVKEALKDGQTLCRLINELAPGSVKKINTSNLAFKQMENIELFLKGCRAYGMKETDTFQTQDLYEAKSIYTVVNCLHILGSLAQKNGYAGPTIGVKIADENVREFSSETLAAGQAVIGLQYGSNVGASQKGMTPYGAARKM